MSTDKLLDYEFPGPWPYEGIITNRDDPEEIGRVKFRIDGEVEPESDWTLPIGNPGAGSRDHGALIVPPLGATVVVFFIGGQADNPRYLPGHYGLNEAPSGSKADKVVWRDKYIEISVDSQDDSYGIVIKDKQTGLTKIELDMLDRQIEITSSIGININTTGKLQIQGAQVTLNNRPVQNAGPPI